VTARTDQGRGNAGNAGAQRARCREPRRDTLGNGTLTRYPDPRSRPGQGWP
jgi:hypothetical protein